MKKCTIEVKKIDDRTVRAKMIVNDNVARTAVAKCSPEDEFDFEIGAKMACDRLFEKKEKFVPYIKLSPEMSFQNLLVANLLHLDLKRFDKKEEQVKVGNIGTPTNYRDANGVKLYVGDTVIATRPDGSKTTELPIVHDEVDGDFVAGCVSSCDSESGRLKSGWKIVKKRSFKDFKNGETVSDYKYILEEE